MAIIKGRETFIGQRKSKVYSNSQEAPYELSSRPSNRVSSHMTSLKISENTTNIPGHGTRDSWNFCYSTQIDINGIVSLVKGNARRPFQPITKFEREEVLNKKQRR